MLPSRSSLYLLAALFSLSVAHPISNKMNSLTSKAPNGSKLRIAHGPEGAAVRNDKGDEFAVGEEGFAITKNDDDGEDSFKNLLLGEIRQMIKNKTQKAAKTASASGDAVESRVSHGRNESNVSMTINVAPETVIVYGSDMNIGSID